MCWGCPVLWIIFAAGLYLITWSNKTPEYQLSLGTSGDELTGFILGCWNIRNSSSEARFVWTVTTANLQTGCYLFNTHFHQDPARFPNTPPLFPCSQPQHNTTSATTLRTVAVLSSGSVLQWNGTNCNFCVLCRAAPGESLQYIWEMTFFGGDSVTK